MTREEEIANAADRAFPTKDYYIPTMEILGFTFGARWADEHPKSPWISVNEDLPYKHKELISTECDKETIYVLVIGKDVIAETDCMEYNGNEWVWQNILFEPTHWMPIPNPPKD